MITFNDINISDDKNTVYIPRRLRDCFCDFLKNRRPDIQYDTISRWEIPGSDFETARNDFYSKHSGMFAGTEYEDYPRGMYVGFVSNIDAEYLLDKLKLFYGSDKDEEVKKWEKKTEPKMRIIKESEDKSDYTIFGLDSRKFEIVGGYEDAVALRKLMDKKHMDHDEIELIVGCLKLKQLMILFLKIFVSLPVLAYCIRKLKQERKYRND